jgi:RNA recognition motif-containing protein
MNIVISNLDSRTTTEDVQLMLKDFGEITVSQMKSIVQSHSGKLLTYAYVRIDDRAVGEKVITQLNNTEVKGNVLGVKEAK